MLRVPGNLTTNSNELLRAAAVAGLGVAYSFPRFFAADERAGRVVRLLEAFTAASYVEIHALYPRTRFLPQATRAFLDALTTHFSG